MELDFTPYFEKYEAIVAEANALFHKFESEMGELVKCGKGCSDCCNALFDITLVEALYVNSKFNKSFKGMDRSRIMERADSADRTINKLKRKVFKASQAGQSTSEILLEVSRARVRCPLLSDDDLCEMYEFRPITCRLYGVPTSIGGKAHTCKLAGFEAGVKYPTVNMDIVLDRLLALGKELQEGIKSRYKEMGNMLVPLSMALITDFDDAYLGVNTPKEEKKAKPAPVEPAPAKPKMVEIKDEPASEACSSCNQSKSACASCKDNVIILGGKE